MNINRKGFEKINRCGRVIAGRSDRIRHAEKEAPLAAFSTIDLFTRVISINGFLKMRRVEGTGAGVILHSDARRKSAKGDARAFLTILALFLRQSCQLTDQ